MNRIKKGLVGILGTAVIAFSLGQGIKEETSLGYIMNPVPISLKCVIPESNFEDSQKYFTMFGYKVFPIGKPKRSTNLTKNGEFIWGELDRFGDITTKNGKTYQVENVGHDTNLYVLKK